MRGIWLRQRTGECVRWGQARQLRHRRWTGIDVLLCLFLLLAMPKLALAQAASTPFLERFAKDAAEAQSVLTNGTLTHSYEMMRQLEALRASLAADRNTALSLADGGTIEQRILEAQIASLGPVPAEGKSEPGAVTKQREILDDRLGKVMAPTLRMREAQAQAGALVAELDARIAALNHEHTMRRSGTPVDPALWIGSFRDIGHGLAASAKVIGATARTKGMSSLLPPLVVAMLLAVLGPVLIFRLWRGIGTRIRRAIGEANGLASKLGMNLALDLSSAALFGIMTVLIELAIVALASPFLDLQSLLRFCIALAFAAVILAIAHWIGSSVLTSPFEELRLVSTSQVTARRMLGTVRYAGAVLGATVILSWFEEMTLVTKPITDLLTALLTIMGGILIWHLANLIHIAQKKGADERQLAAPLGSVGQDVAFDFSTPLSRALKLLSLATVLTALAGYLMLARDIFGSALASLAVIAIAIYLHRSIRMILAALVAGPLYAYRKVLHFIPLLTGLLLLAGSLIAIALIWGYRWQQINDAITLMRTGVTFGDIRVSAGDAITFVFVFIVGYFVTRSAQRFLSSSILPEFGLDRGGQAAIVTGIGYLGVILAALVAFVSTGLDLSSLAFVAGALSVGLGFGLQSVVENFTSGVILLFERPIKEGDWVEVGEHSGIVRKIAVRSTLIETFDRHHIIIPNSQFITGSVKNLSFSGAPTRIMVPIGVTYEADVDRVKSLLLEIACANPLVLTAPEPFVSFAEFGESSIDFWLYCFVADVTTGAGTASELKFEIARQFRSEGIEIPYPQRDIRIRSSGIRSQTSD